MEGNKIYYRRHLPHYQPIDATFFVTFRLTASLPIETITRLKKEQLQNGKTFHRIKGKTIQMQETTDFTDCTDKISEEN